MLAKNITGGTPHVCDIKLTSELTLIPGRETDVSLLLGNARIKRTLDKYVRRGWLTLSEKAPVKKVTPKKRKPRKKKVVEVTPDV